MSGDENDGNGAASRDSGPGEREIARRIFAAEYDDADLSHSESDDEYAPNYVITPTGARINRTFVVGVLTAVERVNEEMLRARIADPTGAFVAYAGQYQPDALAFFERTEPPAFVSLTGKARTFESDGQVYTSLRPESVNEVDAETRDRWVVETAESTLERLATTARALGLDARGDDLAAALREAGVEESLATGIPLALDHYDTGEPYLEAVRRLAVEALEVVAGEREEVAPPDAAPDDRGGADLGPLGVEASDIEAETAAGAAETASTAESGPESEPEPEPEPEATAAATGADAAETETETVAADETGSDAAEAGPPEADATEADATGAEVDADDELGAFDEGDEPLGEFDDEDLDAGDLGDEPDEFDEEMYELDETERQEVEEEYGVEFETGAEVDEPGEADIDVPSADDVDEEAPGEGGAEGATDPEAEAEAETGTASEEGTEPETADATADAAGEAESDEADEESTDGEAPEDVGLESAVVSTMQEIDEGDGADREAVIAAVVDEHGVDPGAVEDAIQEALMDGRCYEPAEDRLKAI